MKIALIDYRAGNLTSVMKALRHLGADIWLPADPHELARADGVIVPGVGHFEATANLDEGWREAILERLNQGLPLLGICLGLQWLFDESAEAPHLRGLGLLHGRCDLLSRNGALEHGRLKVPHVGWNSLERTAESRLLAGVDSGAHAYFTHSYAAPVTADTVATTEYGAPFASVVERDLVFGVQFHPEKSGETGLRILRNFLALTAR
jgi:glutamine amidotransferase